MATGECATVVKESEAEWKARVAKLPPTSFQPADYPIADFVRRAVDAGADAELLLLAAADADHLGVARALVDNHGAVGTIAASDDDRTAKQVGSSSSDPAVRRFFKRLDRFCDTYELAKRPDHKTATSVVRRASDLDGAPVAVKFMAHRDQYECEVNARVGLDNRFVVGVRATSDEIGADKFAAAAAELGYGPYGIAMDAAERNLAVVMLQEKQGVDEIAATMCQLAACLEHLHVFGQRIHGDFKPLNAMRMETGEWKLIDLDASARIGAEPAGSKFSSAYSPPELAQRLFIETDPPPSPLLAHPSFDAWGFGVVLYEALAGEILFRRRVSNDNIRDPAEQKKLCMWRSIDADLLANIVGDEPADEPIYEAGRNLVAWCLQGDPADRPTMAQILAHAFFAQAAAPLAPSLARTQSSPAASAAVVDDRVPAPPLRGPVPLAPVPARKHIFISHFQAEGGGTAHTLFHALRNSGAHAWLDMFEDDLTEQGMKRGVEESDVFVLILTANVLTRKFCRKEIGWALAARKPILVLREDDARFAAFDYDRWRADEVWDGNGWSVPADAARQPYSSLGATPELRAIRDVIDAKITTALPYRRRDFEQQAMLLELLRRAADPAYCAPPVVWRCPSPRAPPAATAPVRLLTVQHEPTGGDLARRLWTSLGTRARRADTAAEADLAIAVLSGGALAAGAASLVQLQATLRSGLPTLFVHSLGARWEFYGPEHRAAPEAVRSAIAASESMAMRDADYEHAAMVDELLERCEQRMRAARAVSAPPPPPSLATHHSR